MKYSKFVFGTYTDAHKDKLHILLMQLIDEDNPFITNNVIRPEDGKEYSNIVNFLESYGLVKENDYWLFDGDEIVFLGILYALENCFGVQQVAIGNDNVFGDE